MKIVCASTSSVPSTTANSIQVMKACHALRQLGHEVTLYIPGETTSSWQVISNFYGLKHDLNLQWLVSKKPWRRYDFALKAIRKAKDGAADVFYTWMIQAAFMAQLAGFPVILELHDMPTGMLGPRLFKWFLKSNGKKRLLIITRALLERLKNHYGSRWFSDITLISPNGTELESYQGLPCPESARKKLGLSKGFTAVYTGHFYIGRGMNLLFELACELPEVNFVWVGGQPDKVAYWKSKVQSAGLKNLTLTGFVPKVALPQYQAAGDVLLMPYEEVIEGSGGGNSVDICSPMKMFDYLAAGRAIISSDLPVIREVLNEGNAIFCPPNDLNAWKDAILSLIDDNTHVQKLTSQALQDVKGYTWLTRAQKALQDF